jgi:hypothetical protein
MCTRDVANVLAGYSATHMKVEKGGIKQNGDLRKSPLMNFFTGDLLVILSGLYPRTRLSLVLDNKCAIEKSCFCKCTFKPAVCILQDMAYPKCDGPVL